MRKRALPLPLLLGLATALLAPACVYRPARFADARPVTEIADDEPPPLLHFRGRYSSV